MLELQAIMNSKVDPNWLAAKYPYLRAVAIEGAEAIEHQVWLEMVEKAGERSSPIANGVDRHLAFLLIRAVVT